LESNGLISEEALTSGAPEEATDLSMLPPITDRDPGDETAYDPLLSRWVDGVLQDAGLYFSFL
jgi:hypothetical protein